MQIESERGVVLAYQPTTRFMASFYDQNSCPCPSQVCPRGKAVRSPTYDDDVVSLLFHDTALLM